jgi:hypothetical protein
LSFEAETRDCQKKEIVCFFEQFFFWKSSCIREWDGGEFSGGDMELF